MNKAFVKEPDTTGAERCPRCGSLGLAVGPVTLAARLTPEQRGQIASAASFCPYPSCEVVYFDQFEQVILASAFARPIYPKDPNAPICACFGFTRHEIEADLAEGGVQRTRALIAQAKSPEARCEQTAFDGRPCIAEVQRYYMQRRG